MGFAEDKFFEFLRSNLNLLNNLELKEMLDNLSGVFTIATREQLTRDLDRSGNRNARFNFLNDLQKRDDWVNHFLRAVWECEHRGELFYTLQAEYRSYRPRRVWEPDSDPPPYSLPSLPSNQCHLPEPYSPPQPFASLPPQSVNRGSPESQPCPPAAPSPSQVQPEQVPRWSPQLPEGCDLAFQQGPSPAPALPHSFSSSDQVDAGASRYDISKAPVPESSPVPPAPPVERESEAPDPPVRYSSLEASPSARRDVAMTQPLQRRSENKEVADSMEQRVSAVNTPKMDVVNDLPRSSVHREVAGSDAPGTSSSPASSVHEGNKAWTGQLQRESPALSQVTNSPSRRLPVVMSVDSGFSAGTGQQHIEQPAPQQSSCRPTGVHSPWDIGKPGVLASTAGFTDATGDTNEVGPLSKVPELEISIDESSNGYSQSSGSSQPSSSRADNNSPTPQKVPTTTTPEKARSWSPPRKSPEENEEPRGISSSARGRPPMSAEENSYEMSRDLSYYRLQFKEDPSVDVMAENNVPQELMATNASGPKDASDRATSQEREKSKGSDLHNPIVIALSAAVVCLSLYIIWLKSKK
ncbi:mitochondrial antiviral-signaling protein isoform 2-T3 [Mantella aurantiaca]